MSLPAYPVQICLGQTSQMRNFSSTLSVGTRTAMNSLRDLKSLQGTVRVRWVARRRSSLNVVSALQPSTAKARRPLPLSAGFSR